MHRHLWRFPSGPRWWIRRYNVTEEERQAILAKVFPEGTDGPLKTFKLKEAEVRRVARNRSSFSTGRQIYGARNQRYDREGPSRLCDDRRYLIEYGFGSQG